MMVNKDTKLYFSVSMKPGSFGVMLYNSAFEALGINAIYKPLSFNCEDNLSRFYEFVSSIKRVGASGLSVSMPFKRLAPLFSWHNSKEVTETKNCNTIIFEYEEKCIRSYCHNTDVVGFEKACSDILKKTKNAVIFGRGAVASSIAYVLKKHDVSFFMTKAPESLINRGVDLLINATPVGMEHVEDTVFSKAIVKEYKSVFDVVVKKETNLTNLAKQLGKEHVAGWKMSKHQLQEQFKIYTGQEYPEGLMVKNLKEMGYEENF